MNIKELEKGRQEGYRKYGYFHSYCKLTQSCEVCDKYVRFGCKVKQSIEDIQTKRILRICKRYEKEEQ